MCNLNILIKCKNDEKKYEGFLQTITTLSYSRNNDADGVYFSGTKKLIKGKNKIDLTILSTDIKKSRYILSHQRISTSGYDVKYSQPFDNKEFVIIHNGILGRNNRNSEESDTYLFFKDFQKIVKENKKTIKNRRKLIVKSIKDSIKKETGSYSIAIYDKVGDKLYYFKNYSTSIYAKKLEGAIFISTSSDNTDLTYLINDTKKEATDLDLYEEKIYEINSSNKRVTIKEVGDFKEYKEPVSRCNNYYLGTNWDRVNKPKKNYGDIDDTDYSKDRYDPDEIIADVVDTLVYNETLYPTELIRTNGLYSLIKTELLLQSKHLSKNKSKKLRKKVMNELTQRIINESKNVLGEERLGLFEEELFIKDVKR